MDRIAQPDGRIFHLSGDFPDPIEPFKTSVVRSLVDLTNSKFSHKVYSINRRSPGALQLGKSCLHNPLKPHLVIDSVPFEHGMALTYHAPARGLFHATMLDQLGEWLAREIAKGPRPHLLVGHKLGIEGIAVARASNLLGVPFAISIQGDSDTKILDARPDLARRLGRIFHEAKVVFPFSPWALKAVEGKLGKRTGEVVLLPCPTDLDQPLEPRPGGRGLITTFHLKNHHRKNLRGLVQALDILQRSGEAPELQVVGGGSEADLAACRAIAAGVSSLRFAGRMDRTGVLAAFRQARGFVMPSLRESFGLVFIEALFAGLPIAYPAGTAVDGFLDGLPFALRVNARDPRSIAKAMTTLDRDEEPLKAELAVWLKSDDALRFGRLRIADDFAAGLHKAIARHS